MAQTNQIKNIVNSLSYEERCLLEKIIFEYISNTSFTTLLTWSDIRFRTERVVLDLSELSPSIELSLVNFFNSKNDPWFEDKYENLSSKTKISKIAKIACQLVNDELFLSNNEDINNEDTTDDNEFFDKLTKTEVRANKQAKVVWNQYRLLNLRKIEKRKRAQKFSKRQVSYKPL